MKAPKKVRVGYRDFAVDFRPSTEMNDERALGLTKCDKAVIHLDESLDPQESAQVLLHEVLHAIWHVMCLPPKPDEETAVSRLSKGLAGVLRDNPDFIKYIVAGLAKR